MITLRDIADTNWFNGYSFIRRLQCDAFGHRHAEMCLKENGTSRKMWCSWCGRWVDKLLD